MSLPASERKRLPVRPSVEHLRKQAKRLALADQRQFADAQHAVARAVRV